MEQKFDLKAKVEEITQKLKVDPETVQAFKKEPVKTIEKITGLDLPDEKMQELVAGIKTKIDSLDLDEKAAAVKGKVEGAIDKMDLDEKAAAVKGKVEGAIDKMDRDEKAAAAKEEGKKLGSKIKNMFAGLKKK